MRDGKVQWHPGFGVDLRIELADELEKVQMPVSISLIQRK